MILISASAENIPHPISKAILWNHPNIIVIKNARNGPGFRVCEVRVNDVFREKIESYTNHWYYCLNFKGKSWYFLSIYFWLFERNYKKWQIFCDFKNGDITAVFKKTFKESKENYRPVRILTIISKILVKTTSKQFANFMDPLLWKYQCGFRRGFSTQNCILAMLESYKIKCIQI